MTKKATPLSPLAAVIHDVINDRRAEIRLYPDLYAEQVADAIRKHQRRTQPHARAARIVLASQGSTKHPRGTRK